MGTNTHQNYLSKMGPRNKQAVRTVIKQPTHMQEFEKMMDFLQTRFLSLEIITANKKENAQLNKVEAISNLKSCKCCKDSHSIYKCPDFQAESPEDRWRFINNEQLCTNCSNTLVTTQRTHSSQYNWTWGGYRTNQTPKLQSNALHDFQVISHSKQTYWCHQKLRNLYRKKTSKQIFRYGRITSSWIQSSKVRAQLTYY